MEAKAGRSTYACRIDIRIKTNSDLQKEAYGASLTTLFSASRQMSAIVQSTAVEKGVPYRIVPEVTVMLGDGRREKSTRLFFLEIRPYRSAAPRKAPEPYLVAAYGVKEVAPAATAAPELPLLRERFIKTRPSLTMGGLAQKEGPIELVIARDYRRYWPRLSDRSCFAAADLHLMKTVFHPGQLLFGEADPEAARTMKKGVKSRLTQGMGESAGSSPSSSRRSREASPAADPPEKRRHDPPPQTRVGEKEKQRARSPSPRSTSAASSGARRPRGTRKTSPLAGERTSPQSGGPRRRGRGRAKSPAAATATATAAAAVAAATAIAAATAAAARTRPWPRTGSLTRARKSSSVCWRRSEQHARN